MFQRKNKQSVDLGIRRAENVLQGNHLNVGRLRLSSIDFSDAFLRHAFIHDIARCRSSGAHGRKLGESNPAALCVKLPACHFPALARADRRCAAESMRILIVEDDAILADAVSAELRKARYAVDCFASGGEAESALLSQDYDAVILDLGLPDMDGLELLRRLRKRRRKVPVLILTARDALDDRVRGLDLGADDYLIKPVELQELAARMRAVIRRAQGGFDGEMAVGNLVLDSAGRRVTLNGTGIELSSREFAVLEILMMRRGRVVSKDALMQDLYEADHEVGVNAVEIVIHRVRKKVQNSGVNIRTVRGLGYLLEPAAPEA
jgi:two-component system OmpR family response regulator